MFVLAPVRLRVAACSGDDASGLVDEERRRRCRNYWRKFENFSAELRRFQLAAGIPLSQLPSDGQLRKHASDGGQALCWAFKVHGGWKAVSLRLASEDGRDALLQSRPRGRAVRERQSARAAELLRPQIDEIARKTGLPPNTVPCKEVLRAHNPLLANKMYAVPGGLRAVAKALGYVMEADLQSHEQTDHEVHQPEDLDKVKRELEEFIQAHPELQGVVPHQQMLAQEGRDDLVVIMRRYLGPDKLARRLGLRAPSDWQYFLEIRALVRSLHEYMRAHHLTTQMPTLSQLEHDGCGALATAIRKHGGSTAFAARFGLRLKMVGRRQKNLLDWGPFSLEYACEIYDACDAWNRAEDGAVQMPPLDTLSVELQRQTALYGGAECVARRLGLALPSETDTPPKSA
eukprot:ctg_1452.g338